MGEKVRKAVLVMGILIVLAGILGLLYPVIGNYINSLQHRNVINDYMGSMQDVDDSEIRDMLQAAREYNQRLYERSHTISDLTDEQYAEYDGMLRVEGSDIMGYLEIPKIKVSLPVYHGTDEAVLQAGVGHLEGSSLPIGGENTHAILTGHSGLPSVKLFTDLDQLEEGDTFTITVLSNTTTYVVDGTEVLLPERVKLSIREGGDDCTLITCTPIGVNTHRLLVHAHREEDQEQEGSVRNVREEE